MSDKAKKESTPPPLLLMPAGGGLTLVPPDQPNIFMPVIQSVPSMLDPEEEAEADSFVGQSLSPHSQAQPVNQAAPLTYFQSTNTGHDPFAQVGHGQPPPTLNFIPTTSNPVGRDTPPPTLPSFSTVPTPPTSNSTGTGNIYRHQGGRPQYAPPPTSFPPPQTSQPPTAMVPPMTSYSNTLPPLSHHMTGQHSSPPGPAPSLDSHAGQDTSGIYTGGLYYQPVRYHWCYQANQDGFEIWRPFSVLDSTQLELAFNTRLQESLNHTVVNTNGGRYDVNVGHRIRSPVYWEGAPVPVRRCSWFYKREGDNRYIPYEESFALRLENEYKKAMETNGWHRRLEFPGNVVIVMHNANVVVQFPASSAPDEWGNVQGDQMRPRVVKRGVDDFATIEYGEREEVDHLVFFVPGIEDMSTKLGNSVEFFVDSFRSNALSLLQSHFTQAFQNKSVNRVEFLPIIWTKALQDGASGLKEQVGSVTLPSTSKLRHFINNTLVDTLFYTSPLYCQKICETVGSEMNRMFRVFLERNESFSGDVSVAGHSLGSVILFDLLLNQRLPGDISTNTLDQDMLLTQSVSRAPDVSHDERSSTEGLAIEDSEKDDVLTLETLLAKVGLHDKLTLFESEQMDLESLIMCTEQDLKDIGLPLGPRKKLLGYLNEEKVKKDTALKEQADQKIREEMEKTQRLKAAVHTSHQEKQKEGKVVGAKYLHGRLGAGQLEISYPQLDFIPSALFALGSPIAVYLSLRGVLDIGEFFQLPTCPRVFNVFHPFDPMAYRLEPLIRANTATVKPVLVPHYKGRKRLHLEFKEAVTRYGTDIKQKIIDSFKSTWNTINDFARAHRNDASKSSTMENEVQSEMDQMMSHIAQQQAEDDRGSVSSMAEEEIHVGQLNEGQRIDYVLQEGPLESFNDYLFALASHSCYWESEDTALLLLKEIYAPLGIRPTMPGAEGGKLSRESSLPPRQPLPPPSGLTSFSLATNPHQTPPSSIQNAPTSFPSSNPGFLNPQSSPFGPSPPAIQPPIGPLPTLFSPQAQQPSFQPGVRRSPYVTPDFNNLPLTQAPVVPVLPPMGPALAGGYRKGQP